MGASPSKQASGDVEVIATNRKARRDYHILEKLEAGIELRGAEVKSIRARDVSINESFARIEREQVMLHNLHVNPYAHSRSADLEPKRARRLLLHKHQIKKLIGQTAEKGRSLVPLSIYLKRGRIKVELALCQGKLGKDKRETLKRKTAEREAARAMAERHRR